MCNILTWKDFCIQYRLRKEMMILYNDSFKIRYKKVPLAIDVTTENDTPAHVHNEFEIILIKRGQSEIKIGSEALSAREGDMILINPMEVHCVKLDTKNEYEHLCMCFDVSLISDREISDSLLDGSLSSPHRIDKGFKVYDSICQCFKGLFEIAEKERKGKLLEASAYVSLMFAHMINEGILSGRVRRDKKSKFYSETIKYISDNYEKDITSKDPARELFYTQSHFCRCFLESFGISFSNFLNIYRISKAKEMLENPNVRISYVAQSCGFSNQNYFARCFKKIVGISPSEYKKYQ